VGRVSPWIGRLLADQLPTAGGTQPEPPGTPSALGLDLRVRIPDNLIVRGRGLLTSTGTGLPQAR